MRASDRRHRQRQAPSYDELTVSVKLLHRDLQDASTAVRLPLSFWTVDTEAELRRTWELQAESVITNRPSWATALLAKWVAECAQ